MISAHRILILFIASFGFSLAVLIGGPAAGQSLPLQHPFLEEWASSPHARVMDEPFVHWNEEGVVPKPCARCHTTAGFRDYIGDDGTKPGMDKSVLAGSGGIACVACHNKTTLKMTSVTFPSGMTIKGLGSEAPCMTCHQGRESTASVNKKLAGKSADTPDKKIGFINIHYRAAAATRYGTQAKGGYEYPDKTYKGLFLHEKSSTVCGDCHTQHTTRVEVASCNLCHRKVKKTNDMEVIRRTEGDFDGDGNAKEGIKGEIETLHTALMSAIQSYAMAVAGKPIVYDSHQYPYFFTDKNVNAKVDKGEAIYPNKYKTWTPRLLRAAYNYQFVAKDPGAYTHNPLYVIQLLQDSLADLATKVAVTIKGVVRP